MKLNLGLEQLHGHEISSLSPGMELFVLTKCEYEIDKYMHAIEELTSSYLNAFEVAKAVRKYGRTQSMIALVGAEAIDAAISFEDDEQAQEGVWQKIKSNLVKFWQTTSSWWDKAIGFIFRTAKYKMDAIDAICKDPEKIKNVSFPLNVSEVLTPRYFEGVKTNADLTLKWLTGASGGKEPTDLPENADVKTTIGSATELQSILDGLRSWFEWAKSNKDVVKKAIAEQIKAIKATDSYSKADKKQKIADLKKGASALRKSVKEVTSKAIASLNGIYTAVKGKSQTNEPANGETK